MLAQEFEQRGLRREIADTHDLAVEDKTDLLFGDAFRCFSVIAHQEGPPHTTGPIHVPAAWGEVVAVPTSCRRCSLQRSGCRHPCCAPTGARGYPAAGCPSC